MGIQNEEQLVAMSKPRFDGEQVLLFGTGDLKAVLQLKEGEEIDLTHWVAELAHAAIELSNWTGSRCPEAFDENLECKLYLEGISGGEYQHPPSGTKFELNLDQVLELVGTGLARALKSVNTQIEEQTNQNNTPESNN